MSYLKYPYILYKHQKIMDTFCSTKKPNETNKSIIEFIIKVKSFIANIESSLD